MAHREPISELPSTSRSDDAETRAPVTRRAYSLPEALLFLYVTCIARESRWILNGGWTENAVAWSFSSLIGFGFVYFLAVIRDNAQPVRWTMYWLWLMIVVLLLL